MSTNDQLNLILIIFGHDLIHKYQFKQLRSPQSSSNEGLMTKPNLEQPEQERAEDEDGASCHESFDDEGHEIDTESWLLP